MASVPLIQAPESADEHAQRNASSAPPSTRTLAPSKVHLPALDGVRAIAILMVVVYHSLNGLPGMTFAQNVVMRLTSQGWLGVDLFFILSGFLITGILMDARESAHALRNFYARRVLRIVPVYVLFLMFSLWLAGRIGTSSADEVAQLHQTQGWYWTYTLNILIALRNWSAITLPTGHLWSLAIEEQFYLVWPLAVLLLSPLTLKRTALACIAGAELCRLGFVLAGVDGHVNFVLLPTRMDTLAAGAFLACAYRDPALWSRVLRARQSLSLLALVLVLATILYRHTIDNQESFEQLVFFPATVALGVVIVSSAAAGSAWLSNRTLGFIARISYGMYIWHVVVIRLIMTKVSAPITEVPQAWWTYYAVMTGGTIAGTVFVAWLSWRLVERPILSLKRFVPSA
ncbi:MAG TPA: acyltransferase [Gemmatimonadaceae bacterium]|nr:acyltransferase [Gemmatimonadaceae bacterium]